MWSRRSVVLGALAPLFAAGLSGVVVIACGDDTASPSVEETAVLKDLAATVARPSYAALKATSDTLKAAIDALTDEPTEASLGAAQEAWKNTQVAWNATRCFAFGPAKDIEGNVRWHLGCDPDSIEETIASGAPFEVASLGTSRKGLPALEYLLFDPGGSVTAILDQLAASADRVAFVTALGADLATQIDALVTAWDAHATELATAGEGSQLFKSPKDAMDALFNQVLYVADLAIAQIATPLGTKTGKLSPELEEARLSDITIADTLAQLAAIGSVLDGSFGGASGLGITDLLLERSAALDSAVRDALAAATASVEAIPPPLRTALLGDVAPLNAAVEKLRNLKRVLTSDVATALGVTVSFSDMDGD